MNPPARCASELSGRRRATGGRNGDRKRRFPPKKNVPFGAEPENAPTNRRRRRCLHANELPLVAPSFRSGRHVPQRCELNKKRSHAKEKPSKNSVLSGPRFVFLFFLIHYLMNRVIKLALAKEILTDAPGQYSQTRSN